MNRNRFALIGAFLGLATRIGTAAVMEMKIPGNRRGVPDWRTRRGSRTPHQGKGEIARRRGQIERGQLREQNDLVRPLGIDKAAAASALMAACSEAGQYERY